MDQVPPPATERLLILMIFLNALQGTQGGSMILTPLGMKTKSEDRKSVV